jgi:hypothetical protein
MRPEIRKHNNQISNPKSQINPKLQRNYPAKLRLKPTLACGRAGELAKNNLQRIEKPNGLDQLGSSIRWKKPALFVKILAVKNLSLLP